MEESHRQRVLSVAGAVLVLATGVIHAVEAPDSFQEAAYKGWLFWANGAGGGLAAVGILFRHRWAWPLGAAVAGGALLGYVASRTVGLPMIPAEPDAWFEPLGVLSLVVEAGYLMVWARLGCPGMGRGES